MFSVTALVNAVSMSVSVFTVDRVSVNVWNQPAANLLTVAHPRRRTVLAFTFLAIFVSTLNEHQQIPDGVDACQWASQTCSVTTAKLTAHVSHQQRHNSALNNTYCHISHTIPFIATCPHIWKLEHAASIVTFVCTLSILKAHLFV